MKKIISVILVVLIVCTSAFFQISAVSNVNENQKTDYYPDAPIPLDDNMIEKNSDIISCESFGKIFFLSNGTLYELNPETGVYNTVDSFETINKRKTLKYCANNRIYIYNRDNSDHISVFNLLTCSYEDSISIDLPRLISFGVDDIGRVYAACSSTNSTEADTLYLSNHDGIILSQISIENTIYEFNDYDSDNNIFYTVGLQLTPSDFDPETKMLTSVLRKVLVNGDSLEYNENEYLELSLSIYRGHLMSEIICDNYLAVTCPKFYKTSIFEKNSISFENPIQNISTYISDSQKTIGSLSAYMKSTNSLFAKTGTNTFNEYNISTGELTHAVSVQFNILSLKAFNEKIFVVGEADGKYYYNLIEMKEPTKIILNCNEITITPDSEFQLNAETDSFFSQNYTYYSENPLIADVLPDGTVYGWRNGETYITCVSDSGFSAQCKVNVAGAVQGNGKLPDTKVLNNYLPYNIKENNYTVHSWVCRSYLTEKADGTYETVSADDNEVIVTEYDKSQKHITGTKTIDFELPLFGGFYSGEKYNFIIFGQNNPDESTETEVLRVVKYSKNWERLTAISAFGWNTAEPFHAGSLRMTECNGKLYVHTCHLFFKDEDGDSHQGNMSFVIDEENDVFISSLCGSFVTLKHGYVSHSFNQFIDTDGEYIYRVDHGDTYPRAITLTKCDANGSITKNDTIELMHFWGFLFDNNTGASVGGMAVNTSDILIVGNSDGKFNERNEDDIKSSNRNAFVISVNKSLEKSSINWLTEHTEDDNIMVGTPQIIKIGSNKNLVMWTETERQNYTSVTKAVTVNHKGEKTSDVVEIQGCLSDCQPILCADKSVRWYTSDREKTRFYSIYPQDIVDYQSNCFGDVNNDGVVDILDATLIQKFAVDKATLTDEQKELADVNKDGFVDVLDALEIQKYAAGMITEFTKAA